MYPESVIKYETESTMHNISHRDNFFGHHITTFAHTDSTDALSLSLV